MARKNTVVADEPARRPKKGSGSKAIEGKGQKFADIRRRFVKLQADHLLQIRKGEPIMMHPDVITEGLILVEMLDGSRPLGRRRVVEDFEDDYVEGGENEFGDTQDDDAGDEPVDEPEE